MSTHWWHGAASLRSGSFFALWTLRVALLPRRQIPPFMWHALRVRAVARVFHPLVIPQGWSRSAVVVEGLLHTQLRVTLRVASVPNLVGKAPPQNRTAALWVVTAVAVHLQIDGDAGNTSFWACWHRFCVGRLGRTRAARLGTLTRLWRWLGACTDRTPAQRRLVSAAGLGEDWGRGVQWE